MFTQGAQCTGNFVFRDGAGRTYVGYAAHCAGRGEATDTNGCNTRSVAARHAASASPAAPPSPTGGDTVGRGTARLQLVAHHARPRRVPRQRVRRQRLRPGPGPRRRRRARSTRRCRSGAARPASSDGAAAGTPGVLVRQLSSLRPTELLSPKTGSSLGRTYGGWGYDVYTATPGIPGDSGSGFLDAQGRALGTLSTVAIAPLPASNGLGNLARELDYAQAHSGIAGLHLVRGTRAFSPLP